MRRGFAFLGVTAVLYVLIVISFTAPGALPPILAAPEMTAIWFVTWIAGIWDIHSLTIKLEEAPKVATQDFGHLRPPARASR
jgi:surface polysaccharide O-acyltransferase-like enzyme